MDKGKLAEILRHSSLGINRMLTEYEEWNEDAIRKRGEILFKSAKKLWPYPGPIEQFDGSVAAGPS